jgi:RIO kinase 1
VEQENMEEEGFKESYIPRRLDEVIDYEKDVAKVQKGGKVIYQTITAMNADLSGPASKPGLLEDQDESSGSDSDDSNSDEENEDENEIRGFKNSARPRDESPNSKKERKLAVKEAKKEKRESKIPKHLKKRKERLGKNNKK